MYLIKNIKYDIYQIAPITQPCKNYSKLLDVSIKLTNNGIKLDVSYLESNVVYNDDRDSFEKKFHFVIKRSGESISEDYIFMKMVDILVADSMEKYYVFYKEECSDSEKRHNTLSDLGI